MTLAFDYRKTHKTHSRGTRAAQPLATDVLDGTLYFVTDEGVIERSNGVVWESYSGAGGAASRGNPGPPGMDAEESETSFMIAGPAGSVTTPGGLTTQVQFNLAGAFAGDADLTFVTDTLTATKVVTSAQLAVGGTIDTTAQVIFKGTFTSPGGPASAAVFKVGTTLALGVGDDGFLLRFDPTITKAGSGTHGNIIGAYIAAPSISGAASVTNLVSLLVSGLTSGATRTYALWVDAGVSRFDGGIVSGGALTVTPAAGSNLNVALSTTGDFIVNTDDLYVDTSTGFVGIGTVSPAYQLSIVTAGAAGVSVRATGTDLSNPFLDFFDTTNSVECLLTTNGSNGAMGTYSNHPFQLVTNHAVRITIGTVGNVTLTNVLNLKNYTVATLPAGVRGDCAYVTDALAPAFLAVIVGGGAVVTPVFYNGANWVGF